MIGGEDQRYAAGHRPADDMGSGNAELIEDADRVPREVPQSVGRSAGRPTGSATGVSLVVADDIAPGGGELSAEALLPPQHGSARAMDEKDRRVRGAAESLH